MFLFFLFFFLAWLCVCYYPGKKAINDGPKQKLNIRKKLRSVSKLPEAKWDAIIIGSGPSGLAVANFLSRLNWKVLVLEQNEVLGGGLHTFTKNACEFHSGLHYVGNDELMLKTLNTLTAPAVVEWKHMVPVYDRIQIGEEIVSLKAGEGAWLIEMLKLFPNDQDALVTYLNEVRKVKSPRVRLFFVLKAVNIPQRLRVMLQRLLCHEYLDIASKTVDEVLDRIIGNNPKLRAFLVGQQGDYGLPPCDASWFVHAGVVSHFMNGAMTPENGSSDIVKKLAQPIVDRGGYLFTQANVNEITIRNGQVEGVIVNGKSIYSNVVVSSVGILPTYRLAQLSPPATFVNLKDSSENSFLFLVFHDCPESIIEHNTWYYESYASKQAVFFSAQQKQKKVGMSTMILISEKTLGSNRQTETIRLKTAFLKVFPNLVDFIQAEFDADGETCKRFLGRKGFYGLAGNCERFTCPDLTVKVPVNGLFMTGQDVVTPGFAGALGSAEITANVVAGYGNLSSILSGKNLLKDVQQK
jgi:all-trans-retinol 13,14-reductase